MFIQSGALAIITNKNFFKKLKFTRSIYVQNTFLLLAVVYIPLVLLSVSVFNIVENSVVTQKMNRIETQNAILKNYIISENYMDNQESDIVETELTQLATVYNGRIQVINSDYKVIKDTYVSDEGKYCVMESVLKAFNGEQYSNYDKKGGYMEFAYPLVVTEKDEEGKSHDRIAGAVLVFLQTSDISDTKEAINSFIVVFFGLMVLVCLGVGVWKTNKDKKVYQKIINVLNKLGNRDFEIKLSLRDNDSTREVAEVFNKNLEKIKQLDESRSQFVSNVSHELKTPITSMKIMADSIVGQDNIPIEIYQEFMQDIATEIDRENDIITDLLDMVRYDKSTSSINYARINLNELIESTLKRLGPIAMEKNIDVVFESFRPVIADVDELKFGRAISNLVENAIKYNRIDGWVRVMLNSDHKYFYITINDSGIGIPEKDLDQIFERFFRVDKARARETGGSGLGLSIVKNVILLHEGEIKVHSKEDEGTTFSIRVPLHHLPADIEEDEETLVVVPDEVKEDDEYEETN